MKEEEAKKRGIRPIVRVCDAAVAGVDPAYMGIGPIPAVRKLLEKTGLKKEDIGLFELNEAFASQALACIRELGRKRYLYGASHWSNRVCDYHKADE